MGGFVIAAGVLLCGLIALATPRFTVSILALLGVSATLSLFFYILGAWLLAVAELSIGIGLVAVLLVFAISMFGDSQIERRPPLPAPIALILVTAVLALLMSVSTPISSEAYTNSLSIHHALWDDYGLTTLLQLLFIFAGVISVIGLLPSRGYTS